MKENMSCTCDMPVNVPSTMNIVAIYYSRKMNYENLMHSMCIIWLKVLVVAKVGHHDTNN